MKIIQYTAKTPEENIALDELFLAKAEAGESGETIRFWESREYFVVLGRAGRVNEENILENCNRDNVKTIRRISGGGTVLQGPGCLNWSTVISYERDEEYRNIQYSYMHILRSIEKAFTKKGHEVKFFPISDLALLGKKISGNAQARKKKYFLHHGTILYDLDLEKVSVYLKHPPKEPKYREGRSHKDFLTNIPILREEAEDIIKEVFPPSPETLKLSPEDQSSLEELIDQKYLSDSWNYMF
ncbi:MAG: lipoate--protein ligase family protein [Candidatus Omnitrophica bacterium]|nr:lipoate--protein ligase family protein [Candidatus Omnitrophota bacterium]